MLRLLPPPLIQFLADVQMLESFSGEKNDYLSGLLLKGLLKISLTSSYEKLVLKWHIIEMDIYHRRFYK